jgi:hypothetical protein
MARKALGMKDGDGREADHISEKKGRKGYNNTKSNLKSLSKTAHMKKSKTKGTGGRPKK